MTNTALRTAHDPVIADHLDPSIRGLFLVREEAEYESRAASAEAHAVIDREEETGEDLSDEVWAAGACARAAERVYLAAAKEFRVAATKVLNAGRDTDDY
jgi:hypothetical protein